MHTYLGFTVVDITAAYTPRDDRPTRYRHEGEDACVMCGKPVGKKPWFILGCAGGTLTIASMADEAALEKADRGYMGCHAVGASCAKKVRQIVASFGLDPEMYLFHLAPLAGSPSVLVGSPS